MEEKRTYHLFDDQTIQEIKDLIIAIGNEMKTEQTWFTAKEAAEYLRCSARTLGRIVSLGKVKHERLDTGSGRKSLRFHRKWLDAYVLGFGKGGLSPVKKRLLAELYE